MSRGPTPELPGFGEYLVAAGILTRERLRAAQAYQRSMKVQLSTAIVTLGLATPQRIEVRRWLTSPSWRGSGSRVARASCPGGPALDAGAPTLAHQPLGAGAPALGSGAPT